MKEVSNHLLLKQHDSNQAAVWILGHVLSGWDGTEPLENPSNLCRYMQSKFLHVTDHMFIGIVYQM